MHRLIIARRRTPLTGKYASVVNLTLPYLTLPCLTLRYLTLRYRTLPYPTTMLSVVDRVFWGLNMLPILILMAFNLTLDSLWDKLLGNRVNLLLQFSAAVMGLFV